MLSLLRHRLLSRSYLFEDVGAVLGTLSCLVLLILLTSCTSVGAHTKLLNDKVITSSPGMTTLRNTQEGGHALHTQDQAVSVDVYDDTGELALSMLSTAGVSNTLRSSNGQWVMSMPGSFTLTEEFNDEGTVTKRTIIGDTVAQLQALTAGREAIRAALLGISADQLEAHKVDLSTLLGITEAAAQGLINGLRLMVAP